MKPGDSGVSKLTPAHLVPFAQEFEKALREGAITISQAREFCDLTERATLEQIVLNSKRTSNPRGNDGQTETGK